MINILTVILHTEVLSLLVHLCVPLGSLKAHWYRIRSFALEKNPDIAKLNIEFLTVDELVSLPSNRGVSGSVF